MTPQEASEELKEEFEVFKTCIHKADWDNPNEELKKIIEANTMAIEVLEQQPCEDCISRQAVLDAIFAKPCWHGSDGSYYHSDDIREAINDLPSVTPKAEWIPVRERLPEHKGDYLVTFKLLFTYPVEVCYFDGQAWDKGQYDAVLAWMPLPQQYVKSEDKE